MPGLLGIVDFADMGDIRALEQSVAAMQQTLMHEDFYHSRQCVCKNSVSVCICKNKINHFPVLVNDNMDCLCFYGELYTLNGKDVLGEDYKNELLISLSNNFEETMNSIDGSFAFLFFNKSQNRYYIVNDITSTIPIYYLRQSGKVYFAPEVKALLTIAGSGLQINLDAIAHFLASGNTYLQETFFKEISYLKPASYLCIDLNNQHIAQKSYWNFQFDENNKDRGKKYYKDGLIDLILQAVKRRIRDHQSKKIGILLSGGYDSRTILGASLKSGVKLDTITLGIDRNRSHSDALIAKKLSDQLGLKNIFYHLHPDLLEDHLERIVYLTDGLTDQVGNYPDGLKIYRKVHQDFDVMLRGEELFGWLGGVFNQYDALAAFGLIPLPRIFADIINENYYQKLAKAADDGIKKLLHECSNKDLINIKDQTVFNIGMPNFWARMNYLKRIVVDIRCPLLDKDLLEFVAQIPPKYRLYRKLFRQTVLSAFPEVFSIEGSRTNNFPDWRESYKKHSNLRAYFLKKLTAFNGDVYSRLINKDNLISFIAAYEQDAMKYNKKGLSLSAKAYQSKSGISKYFTKDIKPLVSHTIKNNYLLYKLALPLYKNKKIKDSWLDDDLILMRLLVLKNWSEQFWKN